MTLTIGIPIYNEVDQIDVAGPWDILSRIPEYVPSMPVKLLLLAQTTELVTTGQGLRLQPDLAFDAAPQLDVLLVPGTQRLDAILGNLGYERFLKSQANAKWVTSVCTGAVLLASVGLLDGHRATTHWAALDRLRAFPQVRVANGYPRWVECGNRLTTGGVSSSIDGAFHLVEMLTGDAQVAKCIQLEIQYNPHPPYTGGDPATADFTTYETMMGLPPLPACK